MGFLAHIGRLFHIFNSFVVTGRVWASKAGTAPGARVALASGSEVRD